MYNNLSRLTVDQLILSNVHLGAYNFFLNVKLKAFLLGVKNERNIINISYTYVQLKILINYLINIVSWRQKILIVKALDLYTISLNLANKNVFFYNKKWVGGILTNFRAVRNSKKLKKMKNEGLSIIDMRYMPSLVFMFNTTLSKWALFEAVNLEIPVAAIMNSDSLFYEFINYPVIGNNKSFESFYLYISLFKNAVLKGQQKERLKILRIM